MRAAVTEAPGTMAIRDDAREPGPPGPGEVVVRPQAVGICGSDFHFYAGELHELVGATLPRVQGHEVAAVVEAVGRECREDLAPGARVALWPLTPCGACRPCRMGRGNVCERFSLIGIHTDGGLQERLTMPQGQVFPIAEERPVVAALAEPVSIAVRAVNRGRVAAGERAVVFGAGPIGQAIAVAALERGAAVLLAPSAGRVVIVGMGPHEVALRVGSFTEKELDVLGTSVCTAEEFAEAVAIVERNGDRLAPLVTHEFAFDRAPEALAFAMENPTDVMKVVIRGAT